MEVDQLYVGVGNFSPCLEDVEPSSIFFQALLPNEREALKHIIVDEEIDEYLNTEYHNPNAVDPYSLTSLESLTLIREEENYDFVISRADEQIGEFRVWFICTNKQVLSWFLPILRQLKRISPARGQILRTLRGMKKTLFLRFVLGWSLGNGLL